MGREHTSIGDRLYVARQAVTAIRRYIHPVGGYWILR
jgi:hypothetical protein